jgi:UDP-N-acetylglucosamine--N-acetylmuramyl-(pentapeptide) pyrophosphoryl-undecaprenol N-acetylglucosamine transferase
MKILFAGGGTLGPVTPLIALAQAWKAEDPSAEFVWVGTKDGPEAGLVRAEGIKFLYLPVARLTRYPSYEWAALPWRLLSALVMAWLVLGREKPSLVACAGGYTGVPLAYAAFLRGIPTWVHQPDAAPLLAVRLVAPVARLVTVAWERSARAFPRRKTEVVGNPVRASVRAGAKDRAAQVFGLDLRLPTLLVFGGGGGAKWINQMCMDMAPKLAGRANVIHITGVGKLKPAYQRFGPHYHAVEMLTDGMADALAAADVVFARAGMGTISELSALRKAAVLVPLPRSPQERNAEALQESGAAIVFSQPLATLGDLEKAILGLLGDEPKRREMGDRFADALPTDVAVKLVRRLKAIAK